MPSKLVDLFSAALEEGRKALKFPPEGQKTLLPNAVERAFWNHVSALPIVAPIDHDDDVTATETADRIFGVGFAARETEPQDVHGRADILHGKPALLSRHRMPAIASDHKWRMNPHRSIGCLSGDARDFAAVRYEVRCFGLHEKFEGGIGFCLIAKEIQEIPLRHERNELGARRQMREIGKSGLEIAESAFQGIGFVMGPLQEPVIETKLVHDLQRRGMDRIAPEVAQEIAVLFEHGHGYPGARQEIAGHHSGRTAPHHTTGNR